MDITITYCSVWNYEPRAAGLAEVIKKEFGSTVKLIRGYKGAYDIVADGKTIFSKNVTGKFPDNDEIIKLLK